jgi:hypothetical protein
MFAGCWGKRRFSELDEQLRNELKAKEIDVFVRPTH